MWLLISALAGMPCAGRLAIAQVNPGAEQSELAQVILKRADEVRFPQEGFEVVATIHHTSEVGTVKEARLFKILSKGNENTLVLTVESGSERGQILLMKVRELWFFCQKYRSLSACLYPND